MNKRPSLVGMIGGPRYLPAKPMHNYVFEHSHHQVNRKDMAF